MTYKSLPKEFDGYTYVFCMTFPIGYFNSRSTQMNFYIDNKYGQLHSTFSEWSGFPNRNTFLKNYIREGEATFTSEDMKKANKYLMAQELLK